MLSNKAESMMFILSIIFIRLTWLGAFSIAPESKYKSERIKRSWKEHYQLSNQTVLPVV